jgi:hypothetical protein
MSLSTAWSLENEENDLSLIDQNRRHSRILTAQIANRKKVLLSVLRASALSHDQDPRRTFIVILFHSNDHRLISREGLDAHVVKVGLSHPADAIRAGEVETTRRHDEHV